MKDVIKKSFLLGLGAASMTKNQAEKIVKELVKKNRCIISIPNKLRNALRGMSISGSNPAKPAINIVCKVKYFLYFET